MAVQACLNGGRSVQEHPGVPRTPAEIAADAVAVSRAGAFSVHVHPRDRRGAETLDATSCDAAVAAIRAAVRDIPVGLSTSAAIERDPFARAAALRAWRRPPDFVSVNLSELGWAGVARAAAHAGIGIEAGLSSEAEAEELADSPFAHQLVRALVETDGDPDDARAISALIPAGVPQLWHGYGPQTWEVLVSATAAGHDIRVGLEDVLTLPNGDRAAGNQELVAVASQLIADSL
jgi:uncharacterized protein (DUF849 family)